MSEHTTHIPEIRRLERSHSDRMLAGVSGGLARYFEIHPAVFRVGFVVLTLLGGAGLLIYAAAALVMPGEGKEDSIATAALRNRRDRPWPLIGIGFLAAAVALLLSRATLWPDADTWVLFLIAGAVILWVTRHGQAKPAESTPDGAQLAARDSRRLWRVVVGIGIVLALLVAAALAAVAAAFAVFDVDLDRGVGERTYVVASAQDLRADYELAIGSLQLDLGAVQLPAGETHVDASVDIGDLQVIVPAGVALRAHSEAHAGYVELLGATDDGWKADIDLAETGTRVLVLDARVGAGSVRVERAVP